MDDWKARMTKAVGHLSDQLAGIRPGSISVGFIETFRVKAEMTNLPLARLASVVSERDRILVRPFDIAHVPAIIRALQDARLNAYAMNPATVAVGVPPMSGEQREQIARHVRSLSESAKVAVRMVRQEARKRIAARGRGSERSVQEATDAAIAEIDRLVEAKLREIGG